ncbi:hypothetical protein AAMO2058_001065200 [Amorphochlora amoebiformis]
MNNRVLLVGIATCMLTQVFKAPAHSILSLIHLNRSTWECWRVAEAGGMPSSHTSLCSSVVATIGFHEGFDSYLFGLAMIITLVIAHDAMGVRWAASMHSRFINAVVRNDRPVGIRQIRSMHTMRLFENLRQTPLKEKLGHRSQEVVVGFFFGLGFAFAVECIPDESQDYAIKMTLMICTALVVFGKLSRFCCSSGIRSRSDMPAIGSEPVERKFSDSYQNFRVLRDGYPETRDLPIMDPERLKWAPKPKS